MTPTADSTTFSRRYRAWLLFLLVLINALNLADRQGIAVSLQAIKLDLRFTDSQLGMLQGLPFALFYTAMGLPLARLAEHLSRTRIIAACVALFGAMCALCGTARSFLGLVLFRIGVGVGDAGFGTPVASLIGDHYSMERRASVMSIIWLGAPIGVVAGAAGASWLAQNVSWRAAFAVIGLSALVVALVALLSLREPLRGACDPDPFARARPPSTWTVFRFLFAKRSMWHVLIGCALAAISMNAIGQFLHTFLVRNYHLGFAAAGRLVALIAGAAMASGLLVGGFGVDWAGRSDRRWYVWAPALGLTLAAPLFLLGFTEPALRVAVVLLIAAHVCMFVYYAPSLALAQNMVGANMRASSAFVVSLVLGLAGIGLGPTLVGFLSDRFGAQAFSLGAYSASCPGDLAPPGSPPALVSACAAASAAGIRHALMVMSLLGLWAALHYLLAARNLRRDLDTRYQPVSLGLDATTPARP
ncbi:MAG TPA: MFS transporter [Steroidobacteraceae bacterium]|nr:MFS transporter [Steroidobacteraceae bacterium]